METSIILQYLLGIVTTVFMTLEMAVIVDEGNGVIQCLSIPYSSN